MTCMHDRDEQCFENCPGCIRAENSEPDPDYLYDCMREDEEYD